MLVGLTVGLAGVGLARAPAASNRTEVAGSRPDVRALFLRDCAVCHGSNGAGTEQGPSLIGTGPATVDFWVSTGRMPLPSAGAEAVRRKPRYPPDVIHALVDYVVSITGGGGQQIPDVDLAAGDAARGGELFRQQCAACHAWSGEGGALVRREAPSTHPATPTQIAEAVRTGPGNMPAFGTTAIDDHDLDSLVAYTRYLAAPRDHGGQPLWHVGPLAEGAAAGLLGLGLLLVAARWIGSRS